MSARLKRGPRSQPQGAAARVVGKIVAGTIRGAEQEVGARSYRAANELRSASLFVLRGQRSGRRYRVPFTKRAYQASAPGEPPAARTGMFRLSWGTRVSISRAGGRYAAESAIESRLSAGGRALGGMLEHGTARMLPRPYKQAVRARAMPAIQRLYRQKYT